MSADSTSPKSPLLRPAIIAALVVGCIGTFATSVFAATSEPDTDALSLAVVALSGVSTVLAIVALAWVVSQRRPHAGDDLVTVCAWTRRVQWQGRWISFEEYLGKRFNVRCTHGICEEAANLMREPAMKPDRATQSPAM